MADLPVMSNADRAQAAREAFARRLMQATMRPIGTADPGRFPFPESANVEDRRGRDTVGNTFPLVSGMPRWNEFKAMLDHPMTPWADLEGQVYPQETSNYDSALARQAGANDISPLLMHVGLLSPMMRGR